MKRRDVLKGAAAVGGLALAPKSVSRAFAAADRKRTLKFVPQADLAVLDPIQTPAFVTRNHGLMVFDTLYGIDDAFQPKPQMAAGHTVENDGKLFRLTLRDGLKFHDGEPVLGRDVVASIKRWGSRDVFGGALMAATNEIVATSDKVVEFRLKKPFSHLPAVLGKPGSNIAAIMPERIAGSTSGLTQVSEIVGSGPFRFVAPERVPGSRAVYEKFDGYVPRQEAASYMAGGKIARFDRVEWHTLPDASTVAAALQSGEIDWWESPTADLAPLLKTKRNLVVEVKDTAGYVGVLRFNHLQKPFDNPAIRRAIVSAIQQADFMTMVAGDDKTMWREHLGFFHPDSPMANRESIDRLVAAPDYERVKRDLQAAGYNNEKVVMLVAADLSAINLMSEVAGDVFRKIGLNLDYQAQDWGTISPRLQSQETVGKGGWSVTCNYTSGIGTLNPAAHTYLRSHGKGALFGWPDIPKIEELRNNWLDAPDLAGQQAICRDLQKEAFDSLPYVPLGLYYQSTAYRSDLTGMLKGVPLFYNVGRS